MMNPTLILPPRYTVDTQALWRAAIKLDWGVERLVRWRDEIGAASRHIVIYGEPLFAQAVAHRNGLVLVYPPDNFLAVIEPEFTLREVALMTLGEARSVKARQFIKPANDKSFPAAAYDTGAHLPEGAGESTPVLVSEVVDWEIEFRCFLQGCSLIGMSPYVRGAGLAQDESGNWYATEEENTGARQFVERLLHTTSLQLPPAFVLDVGLIRGSGWAVVEANTAWGAGICGCNPESVLQTLTDTCFPSDAVPDEAKAFVR